MKKGRSERIVDGREVIWESFEHKARVRETFKIRIPQRDR